MSGFFKVCFGIALGALGVWLWMGQQHQQEAPRQESQGKPLYWVAPMNPDYKRDQPGKSPMGMDLIPVYQQAGQQNDAGTVRISADVINNLGVRTAQVVHGQLPRSINTVGYVQYDEEYMAHIHPRVEGWIEKLHVKAAGNPVKKGTPLYTIYSPKLVNAQEEMLLAMKRNNPALIQASLDRLEALQLPQTAIRQLRKTGKVSRTITLTAPQSGIIDTLAIREGMYVKPDMSLLSIAVLKHIWVIGEIFERQATAVQTGDAVQVWLDYLPGRKWAGKIDYIYPSLNRKTRTLRVRVPIDNRDGFLRPGMFTHMNIASRPGNKTLLIPREALIRTGSQARAVLAQGKGHFKSVAVTIGHVGTQQVEVLSGLQAGDRIVTSAQFLIDSESSKTSDFTRMNHQMDHQSAPMERPERVWVQASIQTLMPKHRMISLKHEAVAAWSWPAMSMKFMIDDGVDISTLTPNTNIRVQIRKTDDGKYRISAIKAAATVPASKASAQHGLMNRSDSPQQPDMMNHKDMPMQHTDHPHHD